MPCLDQRGERAGRMEPEDLFGPVVAGVFICEAARSFCDLLRVSSGAREEKTDVEGTLFVYTRSASPEHGFTIMNRLSMENRTEPITKDLDFQLQDPFLLYRNARLSIYGIWFYDKEECQRIAELMKNLTQYEQLKAHQGAGTGISPMILNSGEGKEVDILQMLTKAKDEYTKCKTCSEPKQITSSSAIYDNPNLIKPIPVKPRGSQQQHIPPGKTSDPEPQHLSLITLFGKQNKATNQETVDPQQQREKLPVRQGIVRSLSYEEPRRLSPPVEKQLCPAIQKLMVRSVDLQPLSELPEQRPCENGGAHPAGEVAAVLTQQESPHNIGTMHAGHSASGTQNLLEKLQSAPEPAAKHDASTPAPTNLAAPGTHRALSAAAPVAAVQGLAQPQLVYFSSSLAPQMLGHEAHSKGQYTLPRQTLPLVGNQTSSPGVVSPQELLSRLQVVQQEQQLQAAPRPALAAKFPAVTQSCRAGKPLESWISNTSSTEKQAPLLQVISPQHVPATVAPSVLMSPMIFTQATCAPPRERDGGLLPLQSPEPSVVASSPLTRPQLQEALLYLIQNDDNFLNIIYEAYFFSMTQPAMKKTM
ncbi:PREDICTED: mRNA-decapping enzyme 1B isoform X2 [Chinchilla lanigera]|uniref:mRNA-decapping enzyme 1B isoform X2 n=1 Tax=Chinchilla lanigera TaxID=34839 RepID=UPI000698C631|nr:PREDICTED: mRNA-decapping enzyme 1B isoform X2 [Chinchilla lanigera]